MKSESALTEKDTKLSQASLRAKYSKVIKDTSTNCFINYLKEFFVNNKGTHTTNLFKLAGERWRGMSREEKLPYMEAANRKKAAMRRKEFADSKHRVPRNKRCSVCGHLHGSSLKHPVHKVKTSKSTIGSHRGSEHKNPSKKLSVDNNKDEDCN